MAAPGEVELPLGTAQYTAPEYFIGEPATTRSDLFSLGVITYQMLSGRLPYGTEVPKARTRAAQEKLVYRSVLDAKRELPAWIDEVLHKAVAPDPNKRYEEISELTHELHHPPAAYLSRTRPALLERNPVVFWKTVSLILLIVDPARRLPALSLTTAGRCGSSADYADRARAVCPILPTI